jgi:hypothetical protein
MAWLFQCAPFLITVQSGGGTFRFTLRLTNQGRHDMRRFISTLFGGRLQIVLIALSSGEGSGFRVWTNLISNAIKFQLSRRF